MPEEVYQIAYKATDTASAVSQQVAQAVQLVATYAAQSKVSLADLGKQAGTAANKLANLAAAMEAVEKRRTAMADVATNIGFIARSAASATKGLEGMGHELSGLDQLRRPAAAVGYAVESISKAAGFGKANVAGLGAELGKLGGQAAAVDGVKASVVGVQRSAYGASKNVEDLGKGLSGLGSKATGLAALGKDLKGIRGGLKGAAAGGKRFVGSLDGLASRLIAFNGIRDAIQGIGQAMTEARDVMDKGGRSNLALRDRYRELANLQGKADPDNATIAGAMRFRLATGATDAEANDALRRFEGGLPAAKAAGNITGNATEGLAADLLREATVTGQRVAVKGGTSGLLASKLAQTTKIGSVDQGLSQFASILDVLNRGDGDLDPLVKSLVRGSGGMVGQGAAFPDLGTFAAAQSVASQNASETVSATRVRQAFSGLQRLKAADPELGLTLGDFAGNVNKLAPLLENADDRDQALKDAGLNNQAERRALVQFYANRKRLADETKAVKAGVDPKTIRGLNATFMGSDLNQSRVAKAEIDAAQFRQHIPDEATAVFRDKAEARLLGKGDLDTPDDKITSSIVDSPITRGLFAAGKLAGGFGLPERDQLPLFLGGKPRRQMAIDAEAERIGGEQARAKGVDPGRAFQRVFGDAVTTPEERLPAIAGETRKAGGNPYGGSGAIDGLLRQLIRVTEVGNEQRAAQLKAGVNQQFLPLRREAIDAKMVQDRGDF